MQEKYDKRKGEKEEKREERKKIKDGWEGRKKGAKRSEACVTKKLRNRMIERNKDSVRKDGR